MIIKDHWYERFEDGEIWELTSTVDDKILLGNYMGLEVSSKTNNMIQRGYSSIRDLCKDKHYKFIAVNGDD